jgi:hypothetical protein
MLRQDEELLSELAMEMDPEDGCLTVMGTDDLSTIAFTRDGIENLTQLLEDYDDSRKPRGRPARR